MRRSVGLLLCVACGSSSGVTLEVIKSAAPYTKAPDFVPRFERVLAMSADSWDYEGNFTGLQVIFQDEPMPCAGTLRLGCYNPGIGIIVVATQGSNCVERSPLAHEILHYVLDIKTGDPDSAHTAPQWIELDEVLYPQLAAGPKLLCATP